MIVRDMANDICEPVMGALGRLWRELERRTDDAVQPACMYEEPGLVAWGDEL